MKLLKIPQHVAIIMDGNGRWAKRRNLSRTRGHQEGVKRVNEIIDAARNMGVKILTLYTFSTENWRRPRSEVTMLMKTLMSVLNKNIRRMINGNIRFQFIGREGNIPPVVLKVVKLAQKKTKKNKGLILNIAFNYGGRQEIIDAVKTLAREVKNGKKGIEDISEEAFSQVLYTKGLPDPDLVIRTSGEMRISNFLLWQASYAEFYFTQKLWPEFDTKEFRKALDEYAKRERRYGDIKPLPNSK